MSSGSQCYSCGAEFGIFRKEHGCKNCGFIFCSKCLGKRIEVPRLNNSKGSVCNRCFALLKGGLKSSGSPPSGSSTQQQFLPSPPLAYKKRMEALKARESQATSAHSNPSRKKPGSLPAMYHGMSKADIEIAERLERLRDRPKCEVETEEQLEDRLAAIKGIDPSRYRESKNKSGSVLLTPARRTQQEQIDDLLEEIASSVALEASLPDPDVIIQQRLDQLRQDDDHHHRHRKKSNDDDDDGGGGGGGGGSRTSSDNPNSSANTSITSTSTNLSSISSSSSNNNNNYYNNSQVNALSQGRTSTDNLTSSSPSARRSTPPSIRTTHLKGTTVGTKAEAKEITANTNTNTLSLSEFLSNNLNKASCGPDKQPYEKNINFGSDPTYEGFDSVNINALMTEVKQVKEEVERNLKRSGSDNVMRAGDRKSWKNFDYTEADLQKEADEVARHLTAEALREKEEEEKNKL